MLVIISGMAQNGVLDPIRGGRCDSLQTSSESSLNVADYLSRLSSQ